MSAKRTHVGVPEDLKLELEVESAEMFRMHQEGRLTLPNRYCDNPPPLHYVIRSLLEHKRAHRLRGRVSVRNRSKHPTALSDASCEVGVNTLRTGSTEIV